MTQPDGIILVTCEYPPFPGGIGTYAGRIADSVRAAGYKATVVAPRYFEFSKTANEPDTFRVLRHHQITSVGIARLAWIIQRSPKNRLLLAADIRSVLLTYMLQPLHRRSYRAMIHGSEVSKFVSASPLAAIVRRAYGAADMIAAN